ncbi:POT family protein [Periconia macrospinosa]|uniref:POT family protein n=1 Tax=Periconia macrospinosa TaxID=97972 RepID=A0A2V1E7B3_9PLEO|nr:POT family protein [Periconia macrospinosa]
METVVEAQNSALSGHERVETQSAVAESEWAKLRRVPDKLPTVALLILAVELGERFTYFGLSGPIQNYINNPYAPGSHLPGALGKGQAVATALGNFFKFWAYASTIIGAVVADQYLGKFKAIVLAGCIYIAGLIILVATATPSAIQNGAGFGGLIAAMVTIGLGTGGIKANVTPMCAEQYQNARPVIKTLETGEKVLVDPELTVQRLFMWFYWVVNVGALSPLITVNIEAKHSFWLAYLIPLIAIVISLGVFLGGQRRYVKVPPQNSAILDAIKVTIIACRERGFQNAKPFVLAEAGKGNKYKFAQEERYTSSYVEDVQRGMRSCKIFVFLPFYFVCWIQIWNNLISQAGEMALHGTPNDLLQNLDPIALIIFIPFLDWVVYPGLRKLKIDFDPVSRIFAGFLLASFSMVYASVLQHYIYISAPHSIHVWIQAPAYIFVAFSEAFIIITGLELAFTQAPKNLRSFISALFWITIGVAAAICIALSPVSQDPYMVWMYGSLGIVGFVAGYVFFLCFRKGGKWSDNAVIIEAVQVENNMNPFGQTGKTDVGKII